MKKICILLVLFCAFSFLLAEEENLLDYQQNTSTEHAVTRQENTSDKNACEYARQAKNIEVWQKYLEKFPEGNCVFEAEAEISELQKNKPVSESQENNFFKPQEKPIVQPKEKVFYFTAKFGLGGDFEGYHGTFGYYVPDYDLKNQFGLSLGLDFDWVVYKNPKTAGQLLLGFGIGFQDWFPTSTQDIEISLPVSFEQYGGYKYEDLTGKVKMSYMRLPLMLNLSYEFKPKSDIMTSVIPKFSFGFNINFFSFEIEGKDKDTLKQALNDYNASADIKFSFAWGLGLNFVFKEHFLVIATIGGDVGSGNSENAIFMPDSKSKNTLYGHHEFITMEFGLRL